MSEKVGEMVMEKENAAVAERRGAQTYISTGTPKRPHVLSKLNDRKLSVN